MLHGTWRLEGEIALLALPPATTPTRQDGLWRHTCCEIFLAPAATLSYVEGNFSPSGAWAAYAFSGYREGMAPAAIGSTPVIGIKATKDHMELTAMLAVPALLPNDRDWEAGLAVVVEETSGALSYWALAHTADRPDFHAREAFRYPLPVPS